MNKLTSSAAGSPASLFPSPAGDRATEMIAGSGRRCFELWLHSGRATSWQRTFLACCLTTTDGFSTRWPTRWKLRATKRSRRLWFQLALSARTTSATGPSLWPTPVKDGDRTTNYAQGGRSLGATARLYPTPRAIYGEHPGMTDPRHLTGAVRMVPTPWASDWKGCGPVGSKSHKHMEGRGYLPAFVVPDREQAGGQLNPTWVEWLMGFPLRWTDLEVSETQLSRKSPSGSDDES